MRKYLITDKVPSYKANLHTHTTCSDGGLSPAEVKQHYKEHGYSILACTDHDVFLPHNELTDENFLMLNGYEIEVNQKREDVSPITKCIKTCHMCLIALDPDKVTPVCWHREKYIPQKAMHSKDMVAFDPNVPDYERVYSHEGVSDMMRLGRENGFFVTYNHPTWSCEDYSDYIGYENMHAMEIANYTCLVSGFPEHNERVYDDMLRAGKRIFCTATDDGHGKGSMCGCYIMVNSEKLEYRAVTDALIKGNFYSSEAPEIKNLYIENGIVTVETSEAAEIRFSTGVRKCTRYVAKNGEMLTSASFELPTNIDAYYFRVTVADKNGKFAYSNAYFTDELTEYLAASEQ